MLIPPRSITRLTDCIYRDYIELPASSQDCTGDWRRGVHDMTPTQVLSLARLTNVPSTQEVEGNGLLLCRT